MNRQRKLADLMNAHDIDTNGNVNFSAKVAMGGTSSNTYPLEITGIATATTDFIVTSDRRVKEHIKTIQDALAKVKALRGVSFNKIGSETPKIGVIAQEVKEIIPEVVEQDNDGFYAVSYGALVGLLIEAIKEQQIQIEELKAKIK